MTTTWRERKKTQLREEIYSVSLRQLRKLGFEGASIERITREVGIGKGTFFNYFESKHHVVEEWFRRLCEECMATLETRRFRGAQAAVQALADLKARQALENLDLVRLKAQISPTSELLLATERELNRQIEDYIVRHLEAAAKKGELRPGLEERFFARLIIDTLTGTLRAWVFSKEDGNLRKIFRDRITFLFCAAHS